MQKKWRRKFYCQRANLLVREIWQTLFKCTKWDLTVSYGYLVKSAGFVRAAAVTTSKEVSSGIWLQAL